MPILDSLERRYGHLAIAGLIRYIAIMQLACFLILLVNPEYSQKLYLYWSFVLEGQVWRLISFLFIPTGDGIIWAVFTPLFMFFISDLLEQYMGAFRVNLFVLLFMAVQIALAASDMLIFSPGSSVLLLMNLFLAICLVAPTYVINLYGIIPVQLRWLGLLDLGILGLMMLSAPDKALGIFLSMLPVMAFAWPMFKRATAQKLRGKNPLAAAAKGTAFNECSVCQRTEISNPELEFRVAEDGSEYCNEHLPK